MSILRIKLFGIWVWSSLYHPYGYPSISYAWTWSFFPIIILVLSLIGISGRTIIHSLRVEHFPLYTISPPLVVGLTWIFTFVSPHHEPIGVLVFVSLDLICDFIFSTDMIKIQPKGLFTSSTIDIHIIDGNYQLVTVISLG